MPARTDDGESSGCDSEPNDDGVDDSRLNYDEEQTDDEDEDDADDATDTAVYSDQLEADVMKQLGLSSWFLVPN